MVKFFVFQFLILGLSFDGFAADAKHGKKLFTEHSCNSCHAMGTEGSATTGPNLAGVTKRESLGWIKKWIKDPDKMLNDPKVVSLKKKYPTPMPNMALSDLEVDDIVAYLKSFDQGK
jgi:mono/diheme cytochrome c family protein